jgi:hypothetical protein
VDNIEMGLEVIELGDMDWKDLDQDNGQRRVLATAL